MDIIIDNRERDLINIFKPEKTSNLDHGDVLITYNDQVFAIFERKTLSDLAASIKDGRYHNQKKSLLESYDSNKLYYIIEGSFDYSNNFGVINGIDKNILESCIINTMIRDHIGVFITKNVNDTCNLIKAIYKRLSDNPDKYICSQNSIQEQVIKSNITSPEQYFEKALCQIPGVSLKTAKAIADIYKTMPNFIQKISTEKEKLKILKEITINSSKGTKRKISEKVARSLIEFIIG